MAVIPPTGKSWSLDIGPLVKIDHDISDPRFAKLCTLCNLSLGNKLNEWVTRGTPGLDVIRVAEMPLRWPAKSVERPPT